MKRLITAAQRLVNNYKQRRTFTKAQAAQINQVLTQNIEVFFEETEAGGLL